MERVSLGNEEFEGHNNAYVLTDGEATTLIDTGIATPPTRTDLIEGLAELGATFEDIDQILLTHWHPDHSGLAGEIQEVSEATVLIHEADAPLVGAADEDHVAYQELQRECFERWGIPEGPRDELLAFFESNAGSEGEPVSITPFTDGDTIEVAGRALRVHHSPGHTAGSCRFEIEDEALAFVGDAVLPVYTPNVGGADVRVDRPLATYLDTLNSIIDAEYDRILPGHRDPIDQPSERARTIMQHHRERTERVIDVLNDIAPATPWEVSAALFGSLENIHIMHGPGEAYAHLDHLVHEGIAAATNGEYELIADESSIETVLETTFT